MPSIQIKHVPDRVHLELRRRASKGGRSLQEYLLTLLENETRHPPIDEVLAEAASRDSPGITLQDLVDGIREDRESH